MRDTIDVLERAFKAYADGQASFPLRTMVATSDGILGAMPGAISGEHAALGAKLVTFFRGNSARGTATHQALIALFDPVTGEPLALMDGRYITEVRTAATSALATRALAAEGATIVAILGTGVQADAHVKALAEIMTISELRIWGRSADKAQALARAARETGLNGRATDSVRAACAGAQVICTTTSSREPILAAADVGEGAHINAVGSSVAQTRELASDLMARCRIVVDSLPGARSEAGDIILAIRDGALKPEPELTLLSDVLAGKSQGRRAPSDITVFKSLGIALEDVACASLVYQRAQKAGAGTKVSIS